ncbi:MFS transporter [Vibrio lamellibrachiae]|uniref:MFS transporter n=1 Tax=Vibrio lamellibrachiae TaxID=2910253 RepID=UPI003D105C90
MITELLNKLKGIDKKILQRFLLITGGSQLIYAMVSIRTVLYEPIRDMLGVDHAQFGLLLSLSGIIQILLYVPVGWISDRFAPRKVLASGMILTGLTGFILVSSPPFWLAFIVFASYGVIEVFYWPSVMKSVRVLAPDNRQSTAFGAMEGTRGGTDLIVNALAIAIFTYFGQTIFGIKVVYIINACLIIGFGILTYLLLPEENFLKKGDSTGKNKEALSGLLKALKMPEVWLCGLTASTVYVSFVGINYFLPFLQNVFMLSATMAALFSLFSISTLRLFVAPAGGLIADRVFGGAARFMRVALLFVVLSVTVVLFVPKTSDYMIVAFVAMAAISSLAFMLRSVYYAPIGEMGIPKSMSGAAMSVASFIGYSPMFWGYLVYGNILDSFEPEQAYNYIFMIMIGFAALGVVLSSFMAHRIKKVRERNEQAKVGEITTA